MANTLFISVHNILSKMLYVETTKPSLILSSLLLDFILLNNSHIEILLDPILSGLVSRGMGPLSTNNIFDKMS